MFFNKLFGRARNKKGFTLVELMVVVAIIGVLTAIAVPKFANVSSDAQTKADAATVRTINGAWSMYSATGGNWPGDFLMGASGNATSILVDEVTYTYDSETGKWKK